MRRRRRPEAEHAFRHWTPSRFRSDRCTPRTCRSTYEIARRKWGVVGGVGGSVISVRGRRNGHNYGSIWVRGYGRDLLAEDGIAHGAQARVERFRHGRLEEHVLHRRSQRGARQTVEDLARHAAWIPRLLLQHDQPRAGNVLREVVGVLDRYELLLRMQSDDGRILPPSDFMPLAERTGRIREIDRWVVRRAIALIAQNTSASSPLRLDVNLSGRAFSDSELLALIRSEIARSGMDPALFGVEVTETAAVTDMGKAREFINALREIGCRVALDDFGAGRTLYEPADGEHHHDQHEVILDKTRMRRRHPRQRKTTHAESIGSAGEIVELDQHRVEDHRQRQRQQQRDLAEFRDHFVPPWTSESCALARIFSACLSASAASGGM